jgi:hypothetical protein
VRERTDAAHLEVPVLPDGVAGHGLERRRAVACDLYDAGLEQRVWAWRRHRVAITFREQSKQLTAAWLLGATGIASTNGGSEARRQS